MTQEEKAKAYDEALERARKIHSEIVNNELIVFPGQIEDIFPQLRESEDERIRKALIDGVRQIRCKNGITQEQMISYLEKQKEPENTSASTMIPSCWEVEQKEQKPADDKSFEEWLDDWYQGSKEAGGDVVMSEVEFKNWSRGIRNMYQQKPAEWSEEDKKTLLSIINAFRNGTVSTIGQEQWLKSLPERFNLQPKQEWSEEDEKMIELIRAIVFGTGKVSNGVRTEIWDWLKSLRPSWKPSKNEERLINTSISFLKDFADKGYENAVECIDWLKSKLNGNSCK